MDFGGFLFVIENIKITETKQKLHWMDDSIQNTENSSSLHSLELGIITGYFERNHKRLYSKMTNQRFRKLF